MGYSEGLWTRVPPWTGWFVLVLIAVCDVQTVDVGVYSWTQGGNVAAE